MAVPAFALRRIQAEALERQASMDPEIVALVARVTAAMAAEMRARPQLTHFMYDCEDAKADMLTEEFKAHQYKIGKVYAACNCGKAGTCLVHEGIACVCEHSAECASRKCIKLCLTW